MLYPMDSEQLVFEYAKERLARAERNAMLREVMKQSDKSSSESKLVRMRQYVSKLLPKHTQQVPECCPAV